MRKLMVLAAAAVVSMQASTAQASTISNLDLVLRLETTGYGVLSIYDGNNIENRYAFLDEQDNIWDLSPVPDFGYTIGQEYSLTGTLDHGTSQFSDCYLGARSCTRAFGNIAEDSFNIGDGGGQTSFGDFGLDGGTRVGDEVILRTFEGAFYFECLSDDCESDYAEWSTYQHRFSVLDNNLFPVPLPAGLPLVLAGIGVFGLMVWRKKKAV